MPELDPQPPEPLPPPAAPPAMTGEPTLETAAPALAFTLGHIRRATRTRAFIATLLASIASGLAVLLVAALLISVKQEWAKPAGWIGAAIASLAIMVRGHWLSRRGHDEFFAARALGRAAPEHASDLLSAVELSRKGAPGASQALIRAHVVRMSTRAAALDPREAMDGRPALIAAGLLALALVVHALLFAFGGNRFRDAYSFLGGRLSAKASPLFAREPIAGDVTLTYRYPAHMKKPARTVPGTDGDISAPKGTVVAITARADRDVQHASVVLTFNVKEQSLPLQVKGRDLSGELVIDKQGQWRFAFQRDSGSVVAEGPDRQIAVETDAPPQVSLTRPKSEIEVMGKELLTLGYNVSDDYGLRAMDLVWGGGHGAPEQRKQIFWFKESPLRERGDFTWDLAKLGLQPGDRISYHLEAWDNDSVSGGETGKKAASESHSLKVFSETEHHEEVLKKAREQWERLISGTGDRLEEPPCGPAGEKATKDWAAATHTHDGLMTAVAVDMRELARSLEKDKHAPAEIGRALAHVASRLMPDVEETSDARTSVAHFPAPSSAKHFVSMLGAEVREEEHDVLYLEDLMDRRRLLDLAQLTRELEAGRKELADLVKQFKESPTEENRQKILAQVARLKERLNELNRRMHELAGEIQDEHLNNEAKDLMKKGDDMMSKLDRVQHDLQKGGGDDALKAVEDLEKQVGEMEKKFNERAGDVDEEQKKLNEKVQQLASDFFDLTAEQHQLKTETDRLRSKETESAKESVKRLGPEFMQKQLERIRRAKSELGNIDPSTLQRFGDDESLQGARDRVGQLERAMQSQDFGEASDQAHSAVDNADSLRSRLSFEREMLKGQVTPKGDDPLNHADDHAAQAQAPLRQVSDDLDKLMKNAKPQLSDSEKRQMQQMGQRQSGLEKRADDLAKRLEDIGKEAPIAGPEQTGMLEQAAGSMGKAKQKLGAGDPRGASTREGEALDKLGQFAKSMKQRRGSGSGSGAPQPFGSDGEEQGSEQQGEGDGNDVDPDQPVDIPGQDQSHAPAEFRRDILDAMKDKSPDNYRDRVRSYYNELVK